MAKKQKPPKDEKRCSVEGCAGKDLFEIKKGTGVYSCHDSEHVKAALLNAVRKNL